MRILLTNDDGVRAYGMTAISDDVWVCAPETEMSAASRGVSLHNPVRMKKLEDRVCCVSGTPTDSVIVASVRRKSRAEPRRRCDILRHNRGRAARYANGRAVYRAFASARLSRRQ